MLYTSHIIALSAAFYRRNPPTSFPFPHRTIPLHNRIEEVLLLFTSAQSAQDYSLQLAAWK